MLGHEGDGFRRPWQKEIPCGSQPDTRTYDVCVEDAKVSIPAQMASIWRLSVAISVTKLVIRAFLLSKRLYMMSLNAEQ
jgi:hypothetical protein